MSNRKTALRAWKILLYTLLSVFVLLQVFPLLWVLDYSLLESGDPFGPELLKLPLVPEWGNYARAWVDGRIARYFLNSAIVVGVSVVASTFLAFCLAYSVTRMQWKLRTVALAA